MDEPHAAYKLLRGVRVDIKALLTNFEKTGSVRFSTFCEEWQRMKFSLIFCQRKTLTELLEFSEEVIHIAKGYLEPPWTFPVRAGALFTLYGLYFKQPIMGAAKIRLIKDEWQHLSQFIRECKEAKHFDICFIHYKLYLKGAYVFTVVPRATGMERGYRKYEIKREVRKDTINERILKRPNIIEPELLEELRTNEQLYSEKKAEVLGKKNLEFVDKEFSTGLITKLNQFYKKIREEHPIGSVEEILAAAKADEEPQPSCSRAATESNKKEMTIHEKRMKKMREKGLKKAVESENLKEEVNESGSDFPVDLPVIF